MGVFRELAAADLNRETPNAVGLDASFDPLLGHDGDHFVIGLFLKPIGKPGLQVMFTG